MFYTTVSLHTVHIGSHIENTFQMNTAGVFLNRNVDTSLITAFVIYAYGLFAVITLKIRR